MVLFAETLEILHTAGILLSQVWLSPFIIVHQGCIEEYSGETLVKEKGRFQSPKYPKVSVIER